MLNIDGNINCDKNLTKLNDYLATRSYIDGYTFSSADTNLYKKLESVSAKFPHALRWYNHMKFHHPATGKKDDGKKAQKDDDDDIDLFGSDEEVDEEAEKAREERLKAYAEKKSKKPGPIAKSNVILDIKPWDDETDMKAMEDAVRTIEMDGLKWGLSKLVPLAYGIKKLQIVCVVEDEKVSIDELSEKIQEFEDLVQSVDIAAFQKI